MIVATTTQEMLTAVESAITARLGGVPLVSMTKGGVSYENETLDSLFNIRDRLRRELAAQNTGLFLLADVSDGSSSDV